MKNLLVKRYSVILYDVACIPIAWLLAFWLRANLSTIPAYLRHDALVLLPFVIVIQAVLFWFFGLYRGQWRFASIPDVVRILKAVAVGSVVIVLMSYFLAISSADAMSRMPPRSILPLYAVFLVILLAGARLSFRWLKEYRRQYHAAQRVLIVGAGLAAESLLRDLNRDRQKRYFAVGLLDDNRNKQGTEILGVRVIGSTQKIPELSLRLKVDLILIALPSADAKHMRNIVDLCRQAKVDYRTLPSLNALAAGDITVNDLRPVSLEDLLGRDPINLQDDVLKTAFQGKRILVTGGGGSIGSELCRQLAVLQPDQLIIVENSEYNLYKIGFELQSYEIEVQTYLQDITDANAIQQIIIEHQPQIVFHAAAYKHVPLLESQPAVAVQNNIMGTQIVAQMAARHGIEEFVLISTDKAVNPSNIMGTSKRMAEIFCQNLNAHSNTRFITVRFGNVLGSRGSVVPLFQQQLKQGGPITVTHPDITRYFMTIPEASQLILQASVMGKGGEIYVLDMGEPVKVVDLAKQIIELAGKRLGDDIDIVYTGLRPGEKLYEELFHEKEALQTTAHQKILTAQAREVDWRALNKALDMLAQAAKQQDNQKILSIVNQWVPENKMR